MVNEKTGKTVVLSEPLCYAERLTLFDFELVFERGRWHVESVRASLRDSATVEDDRRSRGCWRTSTRRWWRTSIRWSARRPRR